MDEKKNKKIKIVNKEKSEMTKLKNEIRKSKI